MKTARTCLSLVAVLALAGTVSAQTFTEDFDGSNGAWSNGANLPGTNNWVGGSGTAPFTSGATAGFLGSRGATYSGGAGGRQAALPIGGTVTSGVFSFYHLLNSVPEGDKTGENNQSMQFGMSIGGSSGSGAPGTSRNIEYDVRSSGDSVEMPGSNASFDTNNNSQLGWMEYHMQYDRDAGTLSLFWRDLNDTDGSASSWTAHSGNGSGVGTHDITHVYLRGFAGNVSGAVTAVDNFSSTQIPEPATLGLLSIGGLLLLRRRRRA